MSGLKEKVLSVPQQLQSLTLSTLKLEISILNTTHSNRMLLRPRLRSTQIVDMNTNIFFKFSWWNSFLNWQSIYFPSFNINVHENVTYPSYFLLSLIYISFISYKTIFKYHFLTLSSSSPFYCNTFLTLFKCMTIYPLHKLISTERITKKHTNFPVVLLHKTRKY